MNGTGTSSQSNILRTELQLIGVVIVWAANYPVAKYAISAIDSFVFNGIRFIVAAIVVGVLFVSRERWVSIARGDWPALLRGGVIASVLYQVAFIFGLSLTTAGNSALLLNTAPLWTVIISARIHSEKIGRATWSAMLLSLVGIILIIAGSGKKLEFGGQAMIGDVISLAAAFFWASNTNLQKSLLVHYSPTQVALTFSTIGAIGLSLIAVPAAVNTEWASIHWTYYAAAIASGALSIGAANVFWSYGVQRLGPGRTGNFGYLIPVLAFIFAYFALGEELHHIQFVGAVLTLVGVYVARR